jgi:death on curing protein
VIYLELPELVYIAERTLGEPQVRDLGQLEAALARPRARLAGEDVYPTLEDKAAAFVQSLARNKALDGGNQKLALAALTVFLGANGRRLAMTNGDAYTFIAGISSERLADVADIANELREETVDRGRGPAALL